MKRSAPTCLFLDIGGVLLNDGWDHVMRGEAATFFRLDPAEMETRHRLVFETFETGRLTLDDYLDQVIFHRPRPFSRRRFIAYMMSRSRPYPRMIALMRKLKARHKLKILVVSNEAREINDHRIHTFALDGFVDAFVSSCFVHLRKPDPAIFRLALDLAQVAPEKVMYIENTAMFVDIARDLGMHAILHHDYDDTVAHLAKAGLAAGRS